MIEIYNPRMKLWQRPSNKIYYAVWMEHGKQRKKSLKTADKKKAKRRYNLFKDELRNGKIKPLSGGYKVKFLSFTEEALRHFEASTELSTYKLYKNTIDRAKVSIGDIPLKHITSRHIDGFVSDLVTEGLKPATVNKYFRHLKSVINLAYRWEYLDKPVRFSKEIKERKKIRFLTNEELQGILCKIEDEELQDFCFLAAVTGLRISELIRLRWTDIDNPEGYINVVPEQKSKKDDRIPINDYARTIFDKYKKDIGSVFRFQSRHHPSRLFKRACVKAGLPDARFHDLRHTYGTTLVKSGVDIRTIQKLMRHSDINSTMIYAEVMPEHLVASSNKIEYDFRTKLGLRLVSGEK